MMITRRSIQRALLSTASKEGLVEFAEQLIACNIALIATGGTAKLLAKHKIPYKPVADVTGFPEILDGRVKTLHPAIHSALLSRRTQEDQNTLKQHNISEIDLVVVNLYPFEETINKQGCTEAEAAEQIDIGGPTMLRSAAKNFAHVTAVVDPADYHAVIAEIKKAGNTTLETRKRLATKVFDRAAKYNRAIADYLTQPELVSGSHPLYKRGATPLGGGGIFPERATTSTELRYGENPHQKAQLKITEENGLANAEQLQGKPLSYNNYVDANAAWQCASAFSSGLLRKDEMRGKSERTTGVYTRVNEDCERAFNKADRFSQKPGACTIVKHATPCGVATASDLTTAYLNAFACDSQSAFGGIIAFNKTVDGKTAEQITEKQFAEVIVAPDYDKAALAAFAKKKNLRVLKVTGNTASTMQMRSIDGGVLLQDADKHLITEADLEVATKRKPTKQEIHDCLFAWNVVRFIKSNAIVYAKDGATLGIGTGQTSRVFAAKIAALKAEEAGLSLTGAAMASDAFFPFADSVELAAKHGIRVIIQPGGSKRDPEVIAMADKHGIAMVFTKARCFLH